MGSGLRPSGLPLVGSIAWGTHLGHFYRTRDDLLDCLVPYLDTGLSNNELCLWLTSDPLRAEEARSSLARRKPELSGKTETRQIQILDVRDWYSQKSGRTDIESTLALLREREEEALHRGYAGLRFTGNASWLGGQDWRDFVENDARMRESFQDRRVPALSSYPLDACGFEDVASVLRHHKIALVRNSGRWELARSASSVVDVLESSRPGRSHHEVQFYEDRSFLVSKLAQYVETGLRRGEGVLIASEESTADPLWTELRKRGLDPEGKKQSEDIVYLEAHEILSRVFRGGRLDVGGFDASIGDVVSRMTARHGSVRIYGELVNVLLKAGEVDALLELEGLWNRLLERRPASLLCGYDLKAFSSADVLRDVSDTHASIHPAESLADFDESAEPGRLVAELQHRALLLDFERRARRKLERERDRLLRAGKRARRKAEMVTAHLGRLQAVTAALSEAATPADIARVILDEMAWAASADEGILAVPTENGSRLKLFAHAGRGGETKDIGEVPTGASVPIAEAFRTGRAVWLPAPEELATDRSELRPSTACLPLHLGGIRMGAIQFGYAAVREFTPADRLLLCDLSRQAALALDRSHLLENAEMANRAKDEFLAMLGHELRNPLSPIVTSLQILRLRGGEAAYGAELDVVERQVRNLVRLVDDLLDISRITQGGVRIEPESVETAEVVARAVELARPLIEQRLHRLHVRIAGSGLRLFVDTARVAQALSNILINSAKYTEPGGDIHVEALRDGGEIAIRIRDNGPGISTELMPRLFDLFVQGHRTPDRRQGGLGIGLTVARSLVELHGGRVAVRSDLGIGAEFTVRLPAGTGVLAPAKYADAFEPLTAHSSTAALRRLLIVDDNEDGANALAKGLRAMGHAVAVAHDPIAGLALARELHPEFALVDIGLPSMDGYELARRLRSLDGLETLRLVAITGYGTETDRIRSRAAGFEAHLMKPVELSMLEHVLGSAPPGNGAVLDRGKLS